MSPVTIIKARFSPFEKLSHQCPSSAVHILCCHQISKHFSFLMISSTHVQQGQSADDTHQISFLYTIDSLVQTLEITTKYLYHTLLLNSLIEMLHHRQHVAEMTLQRSLQTACWVLGQSHSSSSPVEDSGHTMNQNRQFYPIDIPEPPEFHQVQSLVFRPSQLALD